MNISLSSLIKLGGYNKSSRRVGRGYGSTKGGHTSGSGMKGQKSRTGGKTKQWFEGGQTPLVHKMPYRGGFINHAQKTVLSVNLGKISENDKLNSLKSITPEVLMTNGLIKTTKFDSIKILGKGEFKSKIDFKDFQYSKKAIEKIKAAGGNAS